MSDLDNFKNIADSILEHIKVSGDLKEKTLSRCKNKMLYRRRIAVPAVTIGLAAVLALVILNPSLLIGKVRNTNLEASEGVISPMMGSADGESGSIAGSVTLSGAEPIYRSGSLEEAKRYMGEDLRLPEDVPSGFEKELIQVPVDMNKEGMEVSFGYRTENKFFSIAMKKGAASYEYFKGNKEVDINGIKAQLTSDKLNAGDEVAAQEYTHLQWLYKNVLYIIEGQISEAEAIRVAESIK